MEPICHRCGTSLHEGDVFCPHCGAQQLIVDTSDSGGPQQQAQRLGIDPSRVQWRTAITSALMIAAPVGLLSALAGGIRTILVMAGGFAVIALYRRRSEAFTDGRMGWRLGALVGVASAFIATATYAIQMDVARYWMHQGPAIDREFQTAAQMGVDYWAKANAQQAPQSPDVVHAVQRVTDFMLSADGHAAGQLATAVIMSLAMILFAATGGAIAGRILAARPKTQSSI
jgi:hypothetical protein